MLHTSELLGEWFESSLSNTGEVAWATDGLVALRAATLTEVRDVLLQRGATVVADERTCREADLARTRATLARSIRAKRDRPILASMTVPARVELQTPAGQMLQVAEVASGGVHVTTMASA